MRTISIDYQNTSVLINNLKSILNNLEYEQREIKKSLNELYDLENYYSNKYVIIQELENRERQIYKDIQNTEELINNVYSFSNSVRETDERLASKFKQDIKTYAKENNIEIISGFEKFINGLQVALDGAGLFPIVGEPADIVNGLIYLLRGKWSDALISFAAILPMAGDSLKGVRYLDDAKDLLELGDKVVDLEKNSKKLMKATDNILDIKSSYNVTPDLSDFTWKLRGEDIVLRNVKLKEIEYIKRSTDELNILRKEFNSSIRKKFIEDLSNNIDYLKKIGFSDIDILKMRNGRVPNGWQVHHKLPLDDSGTNSFDNLVLIKNEPYHKVITNYQNSFSRNLEIGEIKKIDWPIPEGKIYPKGVEGGFK